MPLARLAPARSFRVRCSVAVATLEPSLALNACESALRELMSYAYEKAYGQAWLDKVSTPDRRGAWAARAKDEASRRRGAAAVPAAGLAYSEFYELVEIVEKYWEPLAPALRKKEDTLVLLNRVERLRNTPAHSRPLLNFEEDLLSGIAGLIRNLVTIYMSAQDPRGDYYPRIESVTDSFGNGIEAQSTTSHAGDVPVDLALHPGDVITFTCVGVDPQDRSLRWWIAGDHAPEPAVAPSGQAATLQWIVAAGDVALTHIVAVRMSAEGTEFHRGGTYDQAVHFTYIVDPPRPAAA